MNFSKRRGAAGAVIALILVSAIIIVAGIVFVGMSATSQNCSNNPSLCPPNTNTTTTGTTTGTTTTTSGSGGSTTTTGASVSTAFISAIGYNNLAGCGGPIGPYPANCNTVSLNVPFTIDGVAGGATPINSNLPLGQHTVVCTSTPSGYNAVQTSITFTSQSGISNYVTCQYSTSSSTTTSSAYPVTVTVVGAPSANFVYVLNDGQFVGAATSVSPLTFNAQSGNHQVTCSQVSGYTLTTSMPISVSVSSSNPSASVTCSYSPISTSSSSTLTVKVFTCNNTLTNPGCSNTSPDPNQFITVVTVTQTGSTSQTGVTDNTGTFVFTVSTASNVVDYSVTTQSAAGNQVVYPSQIPTTISFYISFHGASTFNFLGLSIDAGTVGNIGYGLIVFGAAVAVVAVALFSGSVKSVGKRMG